MNRLRSDDPQEEISPTTKMNSVVTMSLFGLLFVIGVLTVLRPSFMLTALTSTSIGYMICRWMRNNLPNVRSYVVTGYALTADVLCFVINAAAQPKSRYGLFTVCFAIGVIIFAIVELRARRSTQRSYLKR